MSGAPSRASVALLVLALASPGSAHATPFAQGDQQDPDRAVRTLVALRVASPPEIDGRLDEAVWASAPVATGFTQRRPGPGSPASYATEVRVAYDDDALYVGARMRDPDPSAIAAQLGRRDASGLYSDWLHVVIDSYHDHRTAFQFSVNPTGVQRDILHFDDFSEDQNWDGVWEVATAVDDAGWVAEYRIPLSQLRFSQAGAEGTVWGINFGRDIARLSESVWWSPVLPDVAGFVSLAGELQGIGKLRPPRRMELQPYVVAQGSQAPPTTSPFQNAGGRDGHLNFGADLEYGVTSDLTLSATINPDFGQVEADPSVVNLSANETFYPEKRPFFVEGSNIFGFNIGMGHGGEGLFYSRRIGRPPQRGLEGIGSYTDAPGTTTILGAAKVSGKTADGWSVGVLSAFTAEETGRVLTDADGIREYVVEPLANYSVVRTSRDFREGRSAVGFMATGTHRRLDGDPGLSFLSDRAYAAGVDFRHRFADDQWELSGWLAGSYVAGDTVALQRLQRSSLRYYQRPDANHLEYDPGANSMMGYGGTLDLARVTGNWQGGLGSTLRSPGLELNDAGFQTSADKVIVHGNLRYHRFEPMAPFRNWMVGVNPSASWDFGGLNLHKQVNFFANAELTNSWTFGFSGGRALSSTNTRALRGGPAIRSPGSLWGSVRVGSDGRKPVRMDLSGSWDLADEDAAWIRTMAATLTWRPSGRLDLAVGPHYQQRGLNWQYVAQTDDALGDRHYILASIRQRTLSLTTRLSMAFTPTLSLQLYAQPFVSAGSYGGFREVADPRAEDFDDRFRTFTSQEIRYLESPGGWGTYEVDQDGDGTGDFAFGEPDFNFKELRSNLVLRWEYRPGSTLFVVWSHSRNRVDPSGQFRVADDLDRLLGTAGNSVLAIKVNYWLDL